MSDISDQRRYYERMMDEIAAERQEQFDQLRAENAKLRELVRDMACEYECGYLTLPQWLADRMRELGIEVE